MATYDKSFGITEIKFNRYYGKLSDDELKILKYQALDFLYIIKHMYGYNNKYPITKNHLHNVILLINVGIIKLYELQDDEDVKKYINMLVKMDPLVFQKYILTKRTWQVTNKDIISKIDKFLETHGHQELDTIKDFINKLNDLSFNVTDWDNHLKKLEPVNS